MSGFEQAGDRCSPLRVLFTGKNKAGSWVVRGEQIASQRSNWLATHKVGRRELEAFDVFCFVKRPQPEVLDEVRRRKKLIVFDVIDSWAQPDEGLEFNTAEKVKALFTKKWKGIRADAFIFPNQTMMHDLGALTPLRTAIYHHFRPGLEPIEVRKQAKVVGYEGNAPFLGEWSETLSTICQKHGLEFQANPEDFRSIDIGVAVRGGEHDCYMANRYKSNVKLANFYGAAIPCLVGHKERSYHETDNGDVRFFQNQDTFEKQLLSLLDYDVRSQVSGRFKAVREHFEISRMVAQFERFFMRAYDRHQRGQIPKYWH